MMKYFKIIFLLFLSVLVSETSAKKYKGAEYRTKEAFVYGRFEVRYKPANREAVVSSFFTYHDITDSTSWNEIDLEIVGRYQNSVQYNIITKGFGYNIRNQHTNFDPYEDFHVYAFEWTPDYVAWFIDSVEVYRTTGENVKTLRYPQKLMMNIWNPVYTGWVGYWQDYSLPAFSEYDWIEYSSYTPGNGNHGTGNDFTSQWHDDLDSMDTNRWQAATHTFGGNQADFIPENIVFKDGIMTLCLTDSKDTGLVDNISPEVIWARENYDRSITIQFSEEIDQSAGSIPTNYLVGGSTIKEAQISPSRKTVKLITEGYDPSVGHTVFPMNIYDDASPANKVVFKATVVSRIDTLKFPVTVNIGGAGNSTVLDDQEWNSNVEYGYLNGHARTWPNTDIYGTDNDFLYQDTRFRLVTYNLRAPNGEYKLTMHFSENKYNSAGMRLFDIFVEDSLIVDDLDVFAEAGQFGAFDLSTKVNLTDETIDIHFQEQVDSAFINGITVEQLTVSGITGTDVLPEEFKLYQNYPNPFNGYTTISYYLNQPGTIKLRIFNILGEEIIREEMDVRKPGLNKFTWNAHDSNGLEINSGVYFYSIESSSFNETKKLVYLK